MLRSGYFRIVAMVLVVLFIPAVSCADIFVRHNPNGSLDFSDCPMDSDWNIYMKEGRNREHPRTQWPVREIALSYGLDPCLVNSVIEVESGFDPQALSTKGAIGLMQVMPETAQDMGINNPWDPLDNIRAGSRYLSRLLRRYDGDIALALAAYNAGPSVVDAYGGIPPYNETENYVKRVLEIINGRQR